MTITRPAPISQADFAANSPTGPGAEDDHDVALGDVAELRAEVAGRAARR